MQLSTNRGRHLGAGQQQKKTREIAETYNPGCMPEKTLGYDKPDKVKAAAERMRLKDAGGDEIETSGQPPRNSYEIKIFKK